MDPVMNYAVGNCVIISSPGELLEVNQPGFEKAVMSAKSHIAFSDCDDEGIEILDMSNSFETTPDDTAVTFTQNSSNAFETTLNGISVTCSQNSRNGFETTHDGTAVALTQNSNNAFETTLDGSAVVCTENSNYMCRKACKLSPNSMKTASFRLTPKNTAQNSDQSFDSMTCVTTPDQQTLDNMTKMTGACVTTPEIMTTECTLTPDLATSTASLCDSGFADMLDEIKLKCFECVLEWPADKDQMDSGHKGCTCNTQEHLGFEEYVDEIFVHRLSIEDKYHVPDSLSNQPKITPSVRGSLIRWLTTVHHDFRLCQDTLYLAVNIIDRVFDVMQVSRDCLELLGITCLLIGCKQNEVTPPEITELLEKCGDTFTHNQVRQLEIIVLLATSFDFLAPTVQQFLEYFASFCLNACAGDPEQEHRLKMARAVGRCLLELSLPEYEFCQFKPSLLALCVWKASVEYLKTDDSNYYPPGIEYSFEDYDLCLTRVHLFINAIQRSNADMTSFCKKYTSLYNYQ